LEKHELGDDWVAMLDASDSRWDDRPPKNANRCLGPGNAVTAASAGRRDLVSLPAAPVATASGPPPPPPRPPAPVRRSVHLRDVLGSRPGDSVRVSVLGVGLGTATVLYLAELASDADDTLLEVDAGSLSTAGAPAPRVDVLLAMPRPKVLRRLWHPLAQLGVGRVVVCGAAKVERRYWSSGALDAAAVGRELVRGVEQAGDWALPEVLHTRSLACGMRLAAGAAEGTWGWGRVDLPGGAGAGGGGAAPALRELPGPRVLLLAHPEGRGGAGPSARVADAVAGALAALPAGGRGAARAVVAVGPEGGWTDEELGMFDAAGWARASCGPRVLTTEAACAVLVALCSDALDAGAPRPGP